MEQPAIHQDTLAWVVFVHLAFALSLGLTGVGIYVLPVGLWIKGYLAMGLFFTVASTITMSKTLRDRHENKKLVSRLDAVKTEKLLNEFVKN